MWKDTNKTILDLDFFFNNLIRNSRIFEKKFTINSSDLHYMTLFWWSTYHILWFVIRLLQLSKLNFSLILKLNQHFQWRMSFLTYIMIYFQVSIFSNHFQSFAQYDTETWKYIIGYSNRLIVEQIKYFFYQTHLDYFIYLFAWKKEKIIKDDGYITQTSTYYTCQENDMFLFFLVKVSYWRLLAKLYRQRLEELSL